MSVYDNYTKETSNSGQSVYEKYLASKEPGKVSQFASTVKDVAKNLPRAAGQVFTEPFKRPVQTATSLVTGAANVGPNLVNIANKILGIPYQLPKLGEDLEKSDVQTAIQVAGEAFAGYELGGAAVRGSGLLSGFPSRIAGNILGGQVVAPPESPLKERLKQGAFDAAFAGIAEGIAKGIGLVIPKPQSQPSPTPPSPVQSSLLPRTPAPAPAQPPIVAGLPKEAIKLKVAAEVPREVARPVETPPVVEKPVVPAVEGTGPVKTRGLARGVEAKAVEKKLVENLGDLPEYKVVSMKDQAAKASDILAKDYERAKRIATGREVPPADVLPESVYVAVENRALAEGDVATIRDLATSSTLTSEATTMGQRIRTLAERDPDSAVRAIRAVKEARENVNTFQDKVNMNKELLEMTRVQIDEHPGKILQRFISKKEGGFEDFRNPKLAKTPAEAEKIRARNEKAMRAAQRAFEDDPRYADQFDNPDAIRDAIADYKSLLAREKELILQNKELATNLRETKQSIEQKKKFIVQDIKTEIRRARPPKQTWEEFINSIKC